jgi:hypothetical protein
MSGGHSENRDRPETAGGSPRTEITHNWDHAQPCLSRVILEDLGISAEIRVFQRPEAGISLASKPLTY